MVDRYSAGSASRPQRRFQNRLSAASDGTPFRLRSTCQRFMYPFRLIARRIKMAILPSTEEVDAATAAFDPYFNAVGKVVHAWNHVQLELSILFGQVVGLDKSMAEALWDKLTSDRSQRNMLRAAVQVLASDDDWAAKFPKAEEGLKWLLDEADRIADRRNNAIHAPCSIVAGDESDFEIIAVSFHGNRRAKKLRGKDILQEFGWYEACADALRRHVREVQFALSDARVPWPEKPCMPTP
jgi:hypothetical protein